jgi:hypothetical protein
MFKLVSASLAGPHVPNTTFGQMLRPFWCDDSGTALRALRYRPFTHGDPLPVPDANKSMLSQNHAALSDLNQLLLQNLSDRSATHRGQRGEAAGAVGEEVARSGDHPVWAVSHLGAAGSRVFAFRRHHPCCERLGEKFNIGLSPIAVEFLVHGADDLLRRLVRFQRS